MGHLVKCFFQICIYNIYLTSNSNQSIPTNLTEITFMNYFLLN